MDENEIIFFIKILFPFQLSLQINTVKTPGTKPGIDMLANGDRGMRGKAMIWVMTFVRNLLAQHRSIEHARRVATDFVERAKLALEIFPASAERDALMFLPDYVLSRDR